jgi:hypothetical protein
MNAGVELLLKRMETHPEEFIVRVNHGASQWGMLIQQFINHLDEEDRNALEAGTRKCHQEVFTGKVMQSLAGEGEESEDPKFNPYLVKSATGLGGATLGAYSNTTTATFSTSGNLATNSFTLGDTTLSEAGLRQMLATHKLMRIEEKQKRWWNKSIPELLGRK